MKHPVFCITVLCSALLITGTSIAYYNTKTFGFDEDAKIISYDDESVSVMDFTVRRSSVRQVLDEIYSVVPHETFCCEYNVYKNKR